MADDPATAFLGPGGGRRTDDVPVGGIVSAELAGEDLVVWRTSAGHPCVAEARCPHQWAHLVHEGTVEGEELVCLSHFWRFGTDGEGWKQNVNGRRDRKGDLAGVQCVEHDGGIWVQDPEDTDAEE